MIGAEVQKAIFDALNASPAIAGGRIYDRVPEKPAFPYLSIGDEQTVDDGNSCDDGWEVYADIHVWSKAVGKVECKGLVAAIVPRLAGIAVIPGFDVIASEVESTRVFPDSDGLTTHGVISLKLIINPA